MLVARRTAIRVYEGDDPLITLTIMMVGANGVLVPFDFTGALVEFFQKANSESSDPLVATYSTAGANAITILPAPPYDLNGNPLTGTTTNRITIQMDRSALLVAGILFYFIRTAKSLKRQTVLSGPLEIVPTGTSVPVPPAGDFGCGGY